MINESILRATENVHGGTQALPSKGKRASRLKSNALGDVRNTLHSRPTGIQSVAKPLSQKSGKFAAENLQSENAFTVGKVLSQEKVKIREPKYDEGDFHNHNLCEQADDAFFKNLMRDFQLSNGDIHNLVKGVKPGKVAMFLPQKSSLEPCDEIKIPENKIWEDSLNDSSDELQLPEVLPPDIIY